MPTEEAHVDSASCSSGRASDAISEFEPIALEDVQLGGSPSSTNSEDDEGNESQRMHTLPEATVDVSTAPTSSNENDLLKAATDVRANNARPRPMASQLAMLGVDELGISASSWEEDPRFGSTNLMGVDEYTTDMVRDLEKAGEKFASLASNAAADVTKFLKASTSQATDTKSSLVSLASNLSSWFGPSASEASSTVPDSRGTAVTSDNKLPMSQELQVLFSMPDTENILESFKCSLLQECNCTHNSYTTGYKVVCPGVLCVTDVHTCFAGTDNSTVPPFKLAHKLVSKVAKRRQKTGDALLRLEFNHGKEYLHLTDFETKGSMDDALALIELKVED